jgi:hypothetical protein
MMTSTPGKKEKPSGKEKTKVMGKKTYNWCRWHQAWVIHDPTKCTLANKKNGKPKEEHNDVDDKLKALTIDPALRAKMDVDIEGELEYK